MTQPRSEHEAILAYRFHRRVTKREKNGVAADGTWSYLPLSSSLPTYLKITSWLFSDSQTAAWFIEGVDFLNIGVRLVDHLSEVQEAWQISARGLYPDAAPGLIIKAFQTPRCLRLIQDITVNYTLFANLESSGQTILRMNSMPPGCQGG